NLSNLSGMLGLTWHLPGYQADETPPGGALVFSLWRDPAAGTDVVRTEYLAQTLDQMRSADTLTLARPPARQGLAIPGCRAAGTRTDCSWDAFEHVVQQAIDPAFAR
ncbi:MAG: histidine-type phosphatase, partial [Acidobacteriota bacterium]